MLVQDNDGFKQYLSKTQTSFSNCLSFILTITRAYVSEWKGLHEKQFNSPNNTGMETCWMS